ncbi:hypothetical protein MUN88_10315 [Gracilibacillus caseinilyticus]|uniref:Uncharacterized protein n=1 Tax=Gracilibacillus caseinilyticus TaxID=2932256 RepID=A0ABY4F157_9BACI|nr:hypothetical protein [Gracilibacillus caseinilyticus]UOQ50410.1 hypothetical protein MUN88_10315 [Gracilibacillus caseinilyticus]
MKEVIQHGSYPSNYPFVIDAVIVLFVLYRLRHKYNQGELGKKKTKRAQVIVDSLIPMGMLAGCAIGVLAGIYLPYSLLLTISLGTGIGYLSGYFAYEMYSHQENM